MIFRPDRLRRMGLALLALAVLASCGRQDGLAPTPGGTGPGQDVDVVAPPIISHASVAAQMYYARIQQQFLAQGLLRTDGGGADTPYTDRMLAENFIRIALYDEYARTSAGPVQRLTSSTLRRWESPVRVGLRFGASVTPDRRATDTAHVASYLARLSRVTGRSIRLDDRAPNFWVWMVNEEERAALGPTISAALPGLSPGELAGITRMPRSTFCLVYAMSEGNGSVYTRAFAVIRAEHPDLLRLSCLHEEIAQGLGLANDSPTARPSIFNDDEEFALLTTQDELMLKILYDPALRPGMVEDEARPIVEMLATRLKGGTS